jgi:LuxR family maltose regulon positive regulatory protein
MPDQPIRSREAGSYLRAKFVPPGIPSTYIRRPSLLDELDRGQERPVTLVIGLPASGKTTAVADWVASRVDTPWVWVSCDDRDRTAGHLFRALIHTLRERWPDLWADALDLLDDPGNDVTDLTTAIANDLARIGDVLIVLDDCQEAGAGLRDLGLLLQRLPDNVRVVLIARSHPDLPLPGMRAHGLLHEIRQDALRLNRTEVAEVLGRFGVNVSSHAVDILWSRTEGWLAGIQLAALTLRTTDDPDQFIEEFSGSTRAITEYLIEEVLAEQPEEMRRFLTETSILKTFDVELCAKVTGDPNAADLICQIEEQNLFVVPLDDGRSWRYHELFAELLRYQLTVIDSERELELHGLAAEALAARGAVDRALFHYIAAGDDDAVATLLRKKMAEAYYTDDATTLRHCLEEVEAHWRMTSLAHLVDYAFLLSLLGRIEDAKHVLDRSARAAADTPDRALAGRYEVVASIVAACRGDAQATLHHAERATEFTEPSAEPLLRLLPAMMLRAYVWRGDLVGARRLYRRSESDPMSEAEFSDMVLPAGASWMAMVEGEVAEAEALADGVLHTAARLGLRRHPMLSEALRSKGWAHYERTEFDQAEPYLEESLANSEGIRPSLALVSSLSLARLWMATDRVDDARELAQRARRMLPGDLSSPLFELVDDCEIRIALEEGNYEWANSRATRLNPSWRRVVLQTKVALAQDRVRDAERLLADSGFSPGSRRDHIRVNVLQARCATSDREEGTATTFLLEATDIAESNQLLQCLLEEVRTCRGAMYRALSTRPGAFRRRVLEALDRPAVPEAVVDRALRLPDPLSPQETKVLAYLGSPLTQREIAAELYISVNTLKTHVKSIYRKLDVGSRTDATERGRRLVTT